MMDDVIATTDIPYEKGFLYYCTHDERGTVIIKRRKPTGRKKKNVV